MASLKNTTINGALQIANGTIAQRPGSPTAGMIRFNTDLKDIESYNGTSWVRPAFNTIPIVRDGLILYYDGSKYITEAWDDNSWVDLAGVANGTYSGSPVWVPTAGGAIDFNGTSAYIDTGKTLINESPGIGVGNVSFTLECWVYVRSSAGTTTTANAIMGSASDYGVGIQVGINGSFPRFNYMARNSSNHYSSDFNYFTWTYTALSRIAGVSNITYLNGVADASSPSGDFQVASSSVGNFQIGYCSPRVPQYFDGLIGEVRVYNRGLSATEISNNFNATRSRYGV